MRTLALAGKLGVGKTSIVEKAAGVLGLASLRGRTEVADVLSPLRVRNVVVVLESVRGRIEVADVLAPLRVRNVVAGAVGVASLRGRIEVADVVLAQLRVRNVVAGAVGVTSLRGKIVPSDGSVVSSDRYCSRNVYREIGVDPLAI